MVRMVELAARNRRSRRHSADTYNCDVEQRHHHDQNRHDVARWPRLESGNPISTQRNRAKQQAERKRTAIAHENGRRVKVEEQNAGARRR
jgi:hypothetical protein